MFGETEGGRGVPCPFPEPGGLRKYKINGADSCTRLHRRVRLFAVRGDRETLAVALESGPVRLYWFPVGRWCCTRVTRSPRCAPGSTSPPSRGSCPALVDPGVSNKANDDFTNEKHLLLQSSQNSCANLRDLNIFSCTETWQKALFAGPTGKRS